MEREGCENLSYHSVPTGRDEGRLHITIDCTSTRSLASHLQDYVAATSLLEGLCRSNSNENDVPSSSPALRSAIARIFLQSGCLAKAAEHISFVERDPDADQSIKYVNNILLATAYGDWDKAAETAKKLLEKDGGNVVV